MYRFAESAPREFLTIPRNLAQNNDFSMVVDDICTFASMTSIQRPEGMSETEYAAMILDAYTESPEGRTHLSDLGDIAYRISGNFSTAMTILTEQIAPSIDRIIKSMNTATAEALEKKFGYVGKDGNYTAKAPKFFLLDVDQLYTIYRTTAVEFANTLCSRYHYNVEYLNDSNVAGLIRRITPVASMSVSNEIKKAIMEDVVVQISSDSDSEVVINTNDPDNVTVEGATPNVIKEDDQSSRSTDGDAGDTEGSTDPDTNADANPASVDDADADGTPDDDNANANVSVKTDNDNANINITINGETVSTSEEDKELAADIVNACFNPTSFDVFRKKLFVDKGYVRHTHLLKALKFIKKDIRSLIEPIAEKHLPPLEMDMLLENLEQMRELQMAGVIWLDTNSVQYTDTIVIGPNLLNKNLVNRALHDGVSNIIPLIRNYLRAYHNDNPDDLYYSFVMHNDVGRGVSYQKILSSAYETEQVLANAKEATRASYENLIRDAQISAFRDSLLKYVTKLAETSTEEELGVTKNNKAEFLNYCNQKLKNFCLELKNNPQANAEDMIYQLVVGRWYQGTLVEQLYNRIQEGIKMEAATGKELSASNVAMVKAKAVAQLSAEYLFKNFIQA